MSKISKKARNGKVIERWRRKAMDLKLFSYDCQAAEGYISCPEGVQGSNDMYIHYNTAQILTIAAVMEIEDPLVYAHCFRVAGYAVTIAQHMHLMPAEVITIEQAGLLHDVGKVAIAGSILNKPACLTKKEYEKVKAHSVVGERVVRKIVGLEHLAPLVRSHHERYDGFGYPDGVSGDSIPLGARIIAVADAFDAMISNRPYRKARTITASARELELCSGTQFDPKVVQVFLKAMREDKEPWRTFTDVTRAFFRYLSIFTSIYIG